MRPRWPVLALALGMAPDAVPAQVRVGLEQVERDHGRPLRGKRVGLVAHAGSVTADGRHAIDVLRGGGVDVRRLFSPEHGLRSRAAAGEKVAGGVDEASGLPLVSLYGEKTRPAREDLRDLDALVLDLQDAGVRFYTYVSTMILCLGAAAEAGIELVVLDRPNPLGGERVEGPAREAGGAGSLLSMAPGPLVHGLTLGEMARLVNARRDRPARLLVVPMAGWARRMTWAETGRPWVPPSPNLRSAEAALAYPGTALLEATNVSEGRGTEAPFLLIGAPWMDAEAVAGAVSVPGFSLSATRFRPRASRAAPAPKYRDRECAGLRVGVTDARAARPFALGVALLHALRRLHSEFRLSDGGAALDRLLGTRALREALEAGASVDAVLAADEAGVARFRRERQSALLYASESPESPPGCSSTSSCRSSTWRETVSGFLPLPRCQGSRTRNDPASPRAREAAWPTAAGPPCRTTTVGPEEPYLRSRWLVGLSLAAPPRYLQPRSGPRWARGFTGSARESVGRA